MAVGENQQELDALAAAGLALGSAANLGEALQIVVEAAARAAGAKVVIARVADDGRRILTAAAVTAESPALAAELAGARAPLNELPQHEEAELSRLPLAPRRAAERAGTAAVVVLPIHLDGDVRGSLELMRDSAFDDNERRHARVAAGLVSLAIRALGPATGPDDERQLEATLGLAGEALAAGADESRTAAELTRFAAEATEAAGALLWRRGEDGQLELVSAVGATKGDQAVRAAAERALGGLAAVAVEQVGGSSSAALQLGQPPVGTLQLLFADGHEPSEQELSTLRTFGVRAAHALRASMRSRTVAVELDRTRALLAVIGQAIAELSLAHTLETAVARVAELLDADRLAVYLREDDRLYEAAGVGLAGPHLRVAARLLELSLGPFRSRGVLVVPNAGSDARLGGVAAA